MNALEQTMARMDFEYFGTSRHKIDVEAFLEIDEALLLDVRSQEEARTVQLHLDHHCPVLEIPLHEVPERIDELPKDKMIGVFCSSGVRSVIVFAYLQSMGFEGAKVIQGGYGELMDALKPGSVYQAVISS